MPSESASAIAVLHSASFVASCDQQIESGSSQVRIYYLQVTCAKFIYDTAKATAVALDCANAISLSLRDLANAIVFAASVISSYSASVPIESSSAIAALHSASFVASCDQQIESGSSQVTATYTSAEFLVDSAKAAAVSLDNASATAVSL